MFGYPDETLSLVFDILLLDRNKKERVNPFTPKSDFIDFTLSNARRFYASKGDPLGVEGLKQYLP